MIQGTLLQVHMTCQQSGTCLLQGRLEKGWKHRECERLLGWVSLAGYQLTSFSSMVSPSLGL